MIQDWQNDGKPLRAMILTNKEKQLVLGSLLGNSSIIQPKKSKNPHFQMRESIAKEGKWIRCKAYELQRFSRPKSFVQDKDSYRWNSISDPCWKEFLNLCYKDGIKTVSMEWLDQLQDYGIACWFMDKGALQKNMAYIRISRLSDESVKTIHDYFQIIDVAGEIKNFGGSKIISFKEQNLLKFMKLIGHRLPLYYRMQIR